MQARIRVLCALYVVVSPVAAQVTISQEYEKIVQAMQVVGSLGADLFGRDQLLGGLDVSLRATMVSDGDPATFCR